ncbi:hypothetical protein PRUPE_8G171700 [Prunus persica]|nr:hypothetical protein PRUPE_8G171700 [Prunus persica]
MTYLVPDHPPCVLETDLDVRVMYLSLMNEKKYTVTIAIKEFLFPEKQNGVDDMFCGDGNTHNWEICSTFWSYILVSFLEELHQLCGSE